MTYAIEPSDRNVADALRRIAGEQLAKAVSRLSDPDPETLHERIHDARKCAKKLRGLIRMVRPGMPDYQEVNARLRDGARLLSETRELTAVIEIHDSIVARAGEEIDRHKTAPLRKALLARRDAVTGTPELAERIAEFREVLAALAEEVPDWRLDGDGFEVLAGGLGKTFGRARKALRAAGKRPEPELLHDWRKRVKYHWYHSRLLKPIWPEMMAAHCTAADTLGETLGTHRDLTDFAPLLEDDALPKKARKLIAPFVLSDRSALEAEAFALGRRLFAERPETLTERWGAWWELWRKETGGG